MADIHDKPDEAPGEAPKEGARVVRPDQPAAKRRRRTKGAGGGMTVAEAGRKGGEAVRDAPLARVERVHVALAAVAEDADD